MSDGYSAPSLSDDVAITALIISLFALVVGLSQFVQAILGTAEGYRRCASSVIGPWSQLRNRVFRWSEFRFETKYVVPLIALVSESEEVRIGDCYVLEDYCTKGAKQRSRYYWSRTSVADVLRASLHLPEFEEHEEQGLLVAEPGGEEAATDNPLKYVLSSKHTKENTARIKHMFDGLEEGRDLRGILREGSRLSKHLGPRNALPVTWIALLRALHLLYLDYRSRGCGEDANEDSGDDKYEESLRLYRIEVLGREFIPLAAQIPHNRAHTRIAIIPVQETWDFMPPDVARPLAISTISTVIVLSLRLGLQWRTLDRTRSQLNADGNGLSLSSTDVKGLGMVLKFSTFARSRREAIIIPSRAADKLMCGVLPGDTQLVKQDFDLIDRERKLIFLWQPDSIYAKLGLDEYSPDMVQGHNRWTTHNEVVTLLCCFLPLGFVGGNDFYFSGWRSRQYSIFHFFESRLALLIGAQTTEPRSHAIERAQGYLQSLANRYQYEFYDKYTVDKPSNANTTSRTSALVWRCREIFEATTSYFVDSKFGAIRDTDKTWYMQLVAAHARLSAWVNSQTNPAQSMSQEDILKTRQDLLMKYSITSTYFAEHLFIQTERYIAAVDHPEYGVARYMQDRSFPGNRQDIIDAWWMLMLRGIAWDMSCRCLPYPGEPVPSSFYHDETSVWFT